ncbi:MAG: ThiF family adenylyltransferase [Candidatus Micrarchaeota archaeon]|nr:ThiF family adenylyltransferase [Candidatus Micrarchaeota archaeon]
MPCRLFAANEKIIGKEGQRKLLSSSVAVAGLGGVGGIAFELLIRAGFGSIKIADSGFFEESNANRQLLWSIENDGRKKTEAAARRARQLNPKAKVFPFFKIDARNAFAFASSCSALVDATDNKQARMVLWQACARAGTPYIFASALSCRGMLTTFKSPDGAFPLARKKGIPPLSCDHSLGPVANAIGCLAAQQAINFALGKSTISYPEILSIDAFSKDQAVIYKF